MSFLPSKPADRLLWGVLLLGIVSVSVAFLVSLTGPRLPIVSTVKPFTLTNQVGQAIHRESLLGKVWVADVVFSRCPTQCRRLSSQMQRIQAEIPGDVRLVSLTADPAYDTVEVLGRYGRTYGSDPSRWWLLTGTRKELYRLAIEDLKFTVIETGEVGGKLEDLFIHSPMFVVVDREGRVRGLVQSEAEHAEEAVLKLVRTLRRSL